MSAFGPGHKPPCPGFVSREDDYRQGIAEGRRLERAAIVADLRKSQACCADDLADRYERGEHEEST